MLLADKLNTIIYYIKYLLKATDAHGVHSPFVFELYTKIIDSDPIFYAFEDIEALRKELLLSQQTIEITDFGAGSKVDSSRRRKIGSIVASSEKSPRIAQLLFKLVNHFKPATIFDLGTSLGLTTLYLASANRKAQLFTFEGCPQTAAIASENFASFGFSHIQMVQGNIDHTLAQTLPQTARIDFAFFDANHRYQPTINYFELCLTKAHDDTVFVFDDIHWSAEMHQAWTEIKQHPRVTISVDLFHIGLVFFRPKYQKEHFVLKF